MINWQNFFNEMGLIALAVVMTNSLKQLEEEFNWLGVGALVTGLGFVFMIGILRNYKEEMK